MEQTIDNSANVRKKAIIQGLILGVISFVLSIVSLYVTKSATSLMLSSVLAAFLNYVVFIIIAVFFVLALRKVVGGYWEFSTALKNIFIMFAVTTVLSTILGLAWNKVNPGLQEEAINNTINLTIETMEMTGAPDENIDRMIEMLDEQKNALSTMTIGQTIKGVAINLVVYFVLALIFAAIFKKERPVFENDTTLDESHPWQK